MSKGKKILAVLLTAIMTVAMVVTAFAAGTDVPKETDGAEVKVTNVEKDATVTAYQIIKANYTSAGFTGYSAVSGVTISNLLAPTSDEITAIAKSDLSVLKSVSMKTTDTTKLATFKANLNAGSWLFLVTGDVKEVYNPMLVSVYYTVDGMVAGSVDANTNWTLVTQDAYAKSTAPTIDKTIVGGVGKEDVSIGDTVNFQIQTAIPSYSKQYTEVEVIVLDELSQGLTLNQESFGVKVGDNTVGASDETYTITKLRADGFEISFHSAYALANSGKSIVVTYSAVLNENAGINFDANTNTATLTYTNDPKGTTKEVKDRTYTYTFGIDANLNGSSSEVWNKITQELIKGEMVKETVEGEEKEVFKPLAGATFTLTSNTTPAKVYTAISDMNGALTFTGLDAGEYTLVETKAPAGYSVNTTQIPVVISAKYNEDGTLKSYSIKVDGKATSTYEATYEGDTIVNKTVTVVTSDSNITQIQNTKISALPSTGGIGTTIFTAAGCLIMICAAAFLFASRRRFSK